MNYGNSILPTDGAYYTLYNAYISNGILNLGEGGYAKFNITKTTLSAITDYFRVSMMLTSAIDRYNPTLYMYLDATMASGDQLHYSLTPTSDQGVIFTEEIAMQSGEYINFECTIYSSVAAVVQLYELCPQAADSSIEVEIEGVKQSLPRLLYDYNTLPISVDYVESVIGMITFNLLNNTDLQGHLEVAYVASSDCVLTIRIKDTDVTELYTPIDYDIKAGRGNIALPHSYLSRLAGLHSTYVTAQVSTGTLAIGTRGLLYTIDGGYLASREIDLGVTAKDISIKQLEGSAKPDEIWLICVDANEALVKSKPYSSDTSFTPLYTLGPAKQAAIEFNGFFSLDTANELKNHTLYTEETPYAFWTDMDDNLWCQKGDDEDSKIKLDTDVTSISACRGFSSIYKPEQDQGLVVLYIKDGEALYKSYSYVSEGVYTWQGPFTIPCDEDVLSAYVHRLNDYRLSICISTAENNYWYITERTYVTQAAPVEQIKVGFDYANPVVAIFTPDYTYEPISVEATMNSSNDVITLEFSYPIYKTRDILVKDFKVLSGGYSISNVIYVDNTHIQLVLADKNYMGVTIQYVPIDNSLRYIPLEGRHVVMPNFSVTCPGYNCIETINVGYEQAVASVSIRGIETSRHSQPAETIQVGYSSSAASVQLSAIETSRHSQPAETIQVGYSSSAASVVITQTGVSPI